MEVKKVAATKHKVQTEKIHVKKGDFVMVISGKDAGTKGKVIDVILTKVAWWLRRRTLSNVIRNLPKACLKVALFRKRRLWPVRTSCYIAKSVNP